MLFKGGCSEMAPDVVLQSCPMEYRQPHQSKKIVSSRGKEELMDYSVNTPAFSLWTIDYGSWTMQHSLWKSLSALLSVFSNLLNQINKINLRINHRN